MGRTNEYKYVAFISYNTKDMRWAKWIWKKLDRYVMPSSLHKNNSDLPNNLRPIFWDQSGYTAVSENTEAAGKLWPTLKQELDKSDNMIVICSPASADSYWVNREVEYFIQIGRKNHIIPIIVDGTPYASDRSCECMPLALRMIGQNEQIVGFSIEKYGKVGVFSRVVSRILNVELAEIEQRERKRFWINKAKIAVPAAAGLLCLSAYAWYASPHSSYYWSYVYENEIPVGQCPISRNERRRANFFYKLVTQKGKIKSIERVNSAGNLVDLTFTNSFDDPAKSEFKYSDDGSLDSVILYGSSGMPLIMKKYSADLSAVDYVNPYNISQPMALPADLMSAESAEIKYQSASEKSAITRQLLEHDEKGRQVKASNMLNSNNIPVCDINGVYGKRFDYDDKGRLVCITNLGEDGSVMRTQYGNSNIIEKFEYDEKGRLLSGSSYDAGENPVLDYNGVFKSKIRYDENGNPECFSRYGTDNQPIMDKDGIAFQTVQYDENGFLMSYQCLNKEGRLSYYTRGYQEGISDVRVDCDADGRVIQYSFYDADGQPTNTAEGISICKCTYDDQGRVLTESYYDAEGNSAYQKNLRAAAVSYEYYDSGLQKTVCYYDGNGNLALSGEGYSKYVREYEEGRLAREEIMDLSGKKTDLYYNALTLYEYDSRGNEICKSSYNKEEKPYKNHSGFFSVQYQYDQYGNQTSERYYDENGNPCYTYDGYYSQKETEYNELGKPESCRYYDAEGRMIRVNGVYEERMEYDECGRMTRHSYHDANGDLMVNADGYAVLECAYDIRGMLTSNRYRDQDGRLVRDEWTIYDDRGNLLEQSTMSYDEGSSDGFSTFYEYDDYDNCILEYYTDAEGNPVPRNGDAEKVAQSYNEKNQRIKLEYLDLDDNPVNGKNGFAVQIFEYDDKNQRSVTYQYEANEKSGLVLRGSVTWKYNEFGDKIEECYYNADGNYFIGLDYVKKVSEYDFMGRQTQIIYYTVSDTGAGELVEDYRLSLKYIPEDHAVMRTYYKGDNIVETKIDYNDSDNNIVFSKLSYGEADWLYEAYSPTVASVDKEGQAAALGIVPGDIILQYGGWSYEEPEKLENASFADFKYEWLSKENTSRKIEIMHEDNSRDSYELIAGSAGFTYEISKISKLGSFKIMRTKQNYSDQLSNYFDVLKQNWLEMERLNWSGMHYSE